MFAKSLVSSRWELAGKKQLELRWDMLMAILIYENEAPWSLTRITPAIFSIKIKASHWNWQIIIYDRDYSLIIRTITVTGEYREYPQNIQHSVEHRVTEGVLQKDTIQILLCNRELGQLMTMQVPGSKANRACGFQSSRTSSIMKCNSQCSSGRDSGAKVMHRTLSQFTWPF